MNNNYNLYQELESKISVTKEPYPYSVINNFLPVNIAEKISSEFLIPNKNNFKVSTQEYQKTKIALNDLKLMPDSIKEIILKLYSDEFLKILEKKFNYKKLISDWDLVGGGMHESFTGGFLKVHTDFLLRKEKKLKRCLNLIIYFNKNWNPKWNGALELWDKDMKNNFLKLQPNINTAIIFQTSGISNHGFPEPLRCPAEISRKSIALYYYIPYTEDLEFERKTNNLFTMFKRRPRWNFLKVKEIKSKNFISRIINKIFYKF